MTKLENIWKAGEYAGVYSTLSKTGMDQAYHYKAFAAREDFIGQCLNEGLNPQVVLLDGNRIAVRSPGTDNWEKFVIDSTASDAQASAPINQPFDCAVYEAKGDGTRTATIRVCQSHTVDKTNPRLLLVCNDSQVLLYGDTDWRGAVYDADADTYTHTDLGDPGDE